MGQDYPETTAPPARVDPDQAVVALAVAGDVRAFELLVRKYQPRIIRLIGRWVKDSAKCEDVAQDVFISTYRALANFRGDAQFYTWLYRIAANAAKKAAIRQARDPVKFLSDLQPDGSDTEFSEDLGSKIKILVYFETFSRINFKPFFHHRSFRNFYPVLFFIYVTNWHKSI